MKQKAQTKKQSKLSAYFFSERFKPSKLSKYFWMFSATIFLVGVIMLCTLGFNLGLDFTGGNIISIEAGSQVENASTKAQIENAVNEALKEVQQERELSSNVQISRSQVVGQGEEATLQLQYQNISGLTTEDMTSFNDDVQTAIKTKLATVLTGDFTVQPAETKSATASSELLTSSFIALAIAIVAILIYVAIRFELIAGLSAVITLFHDVLLMCALVIICRIEVNASFIAAIITILGYSVNNTIVVFDRVRENMKKDSLAGKSNKEIADISVRQTLTRTFNTSFTTILAVLLLAVIGVSSIREFIIPILFGLVVGTYAAIFISAPLWASIFTNSRFDKRKDISKNKKAEKVKTTEKTAVIEATAEPVK